MPYLRPCCALHERPSRHSSTRLRRRSVAEQLPCQVVPAREAPSLGWPARGFVPDRSQACFRPSVQLSRSCAAGLSAVICCPPCVLECS